MKELIDRLLGTKNEYLGLRPEAAYEIERLTAENERLRAAMEQALDDMGPDDTDGVCVCQDTKQMMRAAFQQKTVNSEEGK